MAPARVSIATELCKNEIYTNYSLSSLHALNTERKSCSKLFRRRDYNEVIEVSMRKN
jgi:hypothetical protein